MRYADSPTVTGEITVAAPPAVVWELVTDIEVPTRLSPELWQVAWLDDAAGPAIGARFEGRNRHPIVGEWRTVSRVVELVPEQAFGWVVTDPDGQFGGAPSGPLASWRFALAPDPAGTLLRQSATIGPGRSGLSVAIDRMPEKEEALVAYRLAELRTGIDTTLAGLKKLAESGPR